MDGWVDGRSQVDVGLDGWIMDGCIVVCTARCSSNRWMDHGWMDL